MLTTDIITRSLQKLGIGSAGEPIDTDDLVYCLSCFNILLDALAADRLTIYETKRDVYDLVAGTASYTIGDGAVWDGFRPMNIVRAGFINTSVNPINPMETPMRVYTDEEWASIVLKTLTNNICYGLWYQTGVPYGTIFPYPIPTVANEVALYVPTPLGEVAEDADGLNTDVVVPKGWRKMLITNLALEVADAFEKTPSALLIRQATTSLNMIKKQNSKPMVLAMPAGLIRQGRGRRFNILTNE